MSDPMTVTHRPDAHRFEAVIDGHHSLCDYELVGGRMIFTHTEVPAVLRGRGIAEALVRTALAYARIENYRVVPACSYVARFIERHGEYHDLLASSPSEGSGSALVI